MGSKSGLNRRVTWLSVPELWRVKNWTSDSALNFEPTFHREGRSTWRWNLNAFTKHYWEENIGYRFRKLDSRILRNFEVKLESFSIFRVFVHFRGNYLGILALNFFHLAHIDASTQPLQSLVTPLFHVVYRFRDIARRSWPPSIFREKKRENRVRGVVSTVSRKRYEMEEFCWRICVGLDQHYDTVCNFLPRFLHGFGAGSPWISDLLKRAFWPLMDTTANNCK